MSAEPVGIATPAWVTTALDRFEEAGFFDEFEVSGHIGAALKKIESPTPAEKKAADAECWAFNFYPQTPGELTEWKTHFGPAIVAGDFRNPDIAWIDSEVLGYWEKRMAAAKHPLLRARYADLVWDMSKPACKLKPNFSAAGIAVDGYVAASKLAEADSAIPASDRLRRALQIALGIGDTGRAEKVRDSLVDLVTRVNETWGWVTLFDTLDEQPKVKLTDHQQAALVAGLEAHVTQAAAKPEGIDPGGTFHVVGRLVRHYQRTAQTPDAERVVLACGQAAERYAAAADHTKAYFWLDQVYQLYKGNGLEAEAERVQLEARRRGELARYEATSISAEVEAPPEQLEKFVTDLTDGGLDAALENIAIHFIPDLDGIRKHLQELRKEFPIGTMWPIAKMSEGQMVGKIGPIELDPEGALLHGVADNIRYRRFYLEKAFDRLRERYSLTTEQVLAFVFQSPMFTLRFRNVIQYGVDAYLAGDHFKAISLLVPQVENSLRSFLRLVGRPPNKPKRGSQPGMTEKSLTDILEVEPIIKERLGEDIHLYLVAFFADARGFNIRNRMCHGLMVEEDFNRGISDRVMHSLLVLGLCRKRTKPTDAEGSA